MFVLYIYIQLACVLYMLDLLAQDAGVRYLKSTRTRGIEKRCNSTKVTSWIQRFLGKVVGFTVSISSMSSIINTSLHTSPNRIQAAECLAWANSTSRINKRHQENCLSTRDWAMACHAYLDVRVKAAKLHSTFKTAPACVAVALSGVHWIMQSVCII